MSGRHRIASLGQRIIPPGRLFQAGDLGDWWSPGDLSKLWQDSGATTPVTAVDDPVRLMQGQRGSFDFLAGSDAVRPLLKRTASGIYYLQFDGVDDIWTAGAVSDFKWLHDGTGGTMACAISVAGTSSLNTLGTCSNTGTVGAYLRRNTTGQVVGGIRGATADVVANVVGSSLAGLNSEVHFEGMTYRTLSGRPYRRFARYGLEASGLEVTNPTSGNSQFGLRFPNSAATAVMGLYGAVAINKELSTGQMLGLRNYWRSIGLFR
jgi:hypothetical protein